MMQYTYALVLFFTVSFALWLLLTSEYNFYKQLVPFLKAAIVVGIPFIAWDVWFTAKGVWWFDTNYTLGFNIAGLPLEEWLFFICIPFSCVFTYFCFDKFFE